MVLTCIAQQSEAQTLEIFGADSTRKYLQLKDGVQAIHSLSTEGLEVRFTEKDSTWTYAVDDIDSLLVRQTDVPCLYLRLPDYPDRYMLWDKELLIDTQLTVNGNNSAEDLDSLMLQIKGRGNSSWLFAKKPMRLKFSKKTALLGMQKSKNYVLLANYLDPTHLKNAVAMWLANRLNMKFANHCRYCNIYINDKDCGLYLLTEKLGINSASVNIDESKGILFELSSEFDEKYKFRSKYTNLPVMVKDPDFDEIYTDTAYTATDALAAWQADFNNAEYKVVTGRPFEAFDLGSAVKFYMINNLASNNEIGFPKSIYMWKDSIGSESKYFLGPVWDFDVAFDIIVKGSTTPYPTDKTLWIPDILNRMRMNSEFKSLYKTKLNDFYNNDFQDLLCFIRETATYIEPSVESDGRLWPLQEESFIIREPSCKHKQFVNRLTQWLEGRMQYLLKEAETF